MIIAVRHIATKYNTQDLLQGKIDSSIIKTIDKSEIKENLKSISSFKVDEIFSSPLKRAIETCELYGFSNPTISNLLTEYDFGQYELTPKQDFIDQHPEWINNFTKTNVGEGYDSFSNRVNLFLSYLDANKNYLIFSHGVVIRYLVTVSKRMSKDQTNKLIIENNSLNFI